MDQIEELLTRGVSNIIPGKEILAKELVAGKKLNIYLGIDPTATQIHLGHAVPLRKLQAFAELGHSVTFLIGDFTALIGDTSDKESERQVLTETQIQQNFKSYKQQAEKVLDFSMITVKHNSEWLQPLTFSEIVKLTQRFSIGDFISRELIRKRLDAGKRIGLHEVLYPVMQGYDSYFMDTDLQLGGTDQTFNMQAGRTLQKELRNKESFIMTNIFLDGADGRKMSKTWGNAIWLSDTPSDMYAKVMAINDDLIGQYYTLATQLPLTEIAEITKALHNGENPINAKKKLAMTIVTELHGATHANDAKESFEKLVQKKEMPTEIPEVTYDLQKDTLVSIIATTGLAASKAEAARLIEQGGVSIDETRITDPNEIIQIKNNMIIKAGKRRFIKIKSA